MPKTTLTDPERIARLESAVALLVVEVHRLGGWVAEELGGRTPNEAELLALWEEFPYER